MSTRMPGPIVLATVRPRRYCPFAPDGRARFTASTSAATLRALFASKRVTDVIVDPRQGSGWAAVLDRIAVPRRVGGVLLYRVDRAGPPC